MANRKFYNLIIMTVMASLPLFTGCAGMIGFGIGYSSDQSTKPKTRIASALPLEPGATIIAVMKDSTQNSGQYIGYCGSGLRAPGDTVLTPNNILPYYGETIEAVDTLGITSRYIFNGFFFHQEGQTWAPFMTVTNPDDSSIQVDLRSLRELENSEGTAISQRDIQNAFADMKVPPLACLVISDSSRAAPIPLDEIDHLEAPLKRDAARRGFLIGLVAGAVVWASLYTIGLTNWHGD